MISFKQFNEEMGVELSKALIPKKLLHWLKRTFHKDKYVAILKLQKKILADKSRNISPEQALYKAAETFGIKPREIAKVMDKKTRHK